MIEVNGRPIPYGSVPVSYMADAIENYFEHGIDPGSFMTALLCNDLKEAFARADAENGNAIRKWVQWLYDHAPSQAWGSIERVKAWTAARRGTAS